MDDRMLDVEVGGKGRTPDHPASFRSSRSRGERYWLSQALCAIATFSPFALAFTRESGYAVCFVVAIAALAIIAHMPAVESSFAPLRLEEENLADQPRSLRRGAGSSNPVAFAYASKAVSTTAAEPIRLCSPSRAIQSMNSGPDRMTIRVPGFLGGSGVAAPLIACPRN